MLENQPPGTSDTSRIATDNINNPNAINAIFLLGERMRIAAVQVITNQDTLSIPGTTNGIHGPEVLKDGADSAGVPGATLRVYVNIGAYSQHWLQQHRALIGLKKQEPFSVRTAQSNSIYWQATQLKFTNIANFFTNLTSFRLAEADGGSGRAFITTNEATMTRGKEVFGQHCAKCHSSKRPPADVKDKGAWFASAVLKDDFLENNFLSDDKDHGLDEIGTNAGRTCGTNAKRGHIWDTFSSENYKNRKSIGEIVVWNPLTRRNEPFAIPGDGPGYYRTPSLVSVWSSAPLLHNNSVGEFTDDPSVAGRVRAFTDAMQKLLSKREAGQNSIVWRTKRDCWLEINRANLPPLLQPMCFLLNVPALWASAALLSGVVLWFVGRRSQRPVLKGGGGALMVFAILIFAVNLKYQPHVLKIGPIPEGTPVNLIANLDPEKLNTWQLMKLAWKANRGLTRIELDGMDSAQARELLAKEVGNDFWEASKCRDFAEDRGHTFGHNLSESDKLALIEFLKTF